MQNKGIIRLFAVLLALVCLYQLSFTYVARKVRKDAGEYAMGDEKKERYYLDSVATEPVYNFLWLAEYTYNEVKELEMNLGLDLQGGMNVTLEVSVVDLIRSLANNSKDTTFVAALKLAREMQKDSQDDFVDLFGRAFTKIDPNARLASIFLTPELKDQIQYNSSNQEVLKVIKKETNDAIDNAFNILRERIDRFGVAQPNIQQLQTKGRILVELPGIKEPERVRKLLQGTAKLEFWETYENSEVLPYLQQINSRLAEMKAAEVKVEEKVAEVVEKKEADEEGEDDSLLSELESRKDSVDVQADFAKQAPLFAVMRPNISMDGRPYPGPAVGVVHFRDTVRVNDYLKMQQIRSIIPRNMVFRWTVKSIDEEGEYFQLIALKVTGRDGKAPLDGDVITGARSEFEQGTAQAQVSMSMNAEGAKVWARLTKENIGKSIAIVLDNFVYSYPTVQGEISGGRSQISGNFTVNEAKDLANVLKSGKMPAPARIVAEEMVGPTLGKESINSGMWSFLIAFFLILLYMIFIYSGSAGGVANLALVANLFFIMGVLASLGAVLTLPGIAGLVLTIGMSVDANVLIYERIQEELKAGKGLRLAISDGYKNAYSAIIDGQLTTLLTGIILYMFGSGPIKGFATTLIIGICTSLFSAIFITRLTFERKLGKNKKISFVSKISEKWLTDASIKFLEKRRAAYILSGAIILISIASFAIKGLNYSIDFKGGRTYVVRFDEDVKVEDVKKSLRDVYGEAPEVKTFGGDNQVRITTEYRIDEDGVDEDVESKLYDGLKEMSGGVAKADFLSKNVMSSTRVGPTISDDIKKDAAISIFFSLVMIFLYILIRFRNWQYGFGAIAALAHDSLIVLGIFSIFDGLLPFSLEIDQAFIAAILTVVGYSINDTVVVFDRIREYIGLHPKRNRIEVTDSALNSTLRRTFSTSLSTFIVLLAIFLFGGTSIKGFTFALMVGVIVGTYSSLFIATPIAHDTQKRAIKAISKK